jgi:hypothetical protein
MTLSNNGLAINVDLKGNQNWNGGFLLLSAAANLQAGYCTDLTEQGRQRPEARRPGQKRFLPICGAPLPGRCRRPATTCTSKAVQLCVGELTAIDLRFEQHCEGWAAAQHGVIHWVK